MFMTSCELFNLDGEEISTEDVFKLEVALNPLNIETDLFDVQYGALENIGSYPEIESFKFDVLLGKGNLLVDAETSEIMGNDDFIFFKLYSLENDKIANGTYSFGENITGSLNPNSFEIGFGQVSTMSQTNIMMMSGGTITVTNENEFTLLDFDIRLIDDTSLTGKCLVIFDRL